ncbi:MAG: preprotein translocase subunit YajC [Gammaproteobacteria bacterium]|jgi:preprotein translocase subunit YajC|nr:preprotein translocase subunit YajC [Gammaproteobacteria bacterium]
MNFLIEDALAQGAPGAQGGGIEFFIMIGIFFLIMYFMIIRPQSKRAKEHKQMVDTLSKGDEVVSNGGLLGKITSVGDSFVDLQVAEGVEIKLQKSAVASVLPKGSIKGS